MAVNTTYQSMVTHLQNAYTSIANKNGTIPQNKNLENLATSINSIQTGGGGSGSASNDYDLILNGLYGGMPTYLINQIMSGAYIVE